MTIWKPIDTAPRPAPDKRGEGPHFLAYQDGMMVVGCFYRLGFYDPPMVDFSMVHVGGYECEEDVRKPTHWTELPDPPESGQ